MECRLPACLVDNDSGFIYRLGLFLVLVWWGFGFHICHMVAFLQRVSGVFTWFCFLGKLVVELVSALE